MKILIGVIALSILVACNKDPEAVTRAGNGFDVERLFTVDGCTVYRFYEGGRNRYFTNCTGSTAWTEICGKNCVTDIEIAGNSNNPLQPTYKRME